MRSAVLLICLAVSTSGYARGGGHGGGHGAGRVASRVQQRSSGGNVARTIDRTIGKVAAVASVALGAARCTRDWYSSYQADDIDTPERKWNHHEAVLIAQARAAVPQHPPMLSATELLRNFR